MSSAAGDVLGVRAQQQQQRVESGTVPVDFIHPLAGDGDGAAFGPAARVSERYSENGDISPFLVSDGGLEHAFRWCITESVVHHQSKLTRNGARPAPAFCG